MLTMAVFALTMIAAMFVNARPPRDLAPDQPPPHAASPNIVLIVLDTVRADHLSVYGYGRNTTPNLAQFAKNATLYARAYARANMTLPSHASLFTGLYASEHTAHYDEGWPIGRPLPSQALTAAELLSARGYATACIAANGYLGEGFGLDQGFQHDDVRAPWMPYGLASDFYLRSRIAAVASRVIKLPRRRRLLSRGARRSPIWRLRISTARPASGGRFSWSSITATPTIHTSRRSRTTRCSPAMTRRSRSSWRTGCSLPSPRKSEDHAWRARAPDLAIRRRDCVPRPRGRARDHRITRARRVRPDAHHRALRSRRVVRRAWRHHARPHQLRPRDARAADREGAGSDCRQCRRGAGQSASDLAIAIVDAAAVCDHDRVVSDARTRRHASVTPRRDSEDRRHAEDEPARAIDPEMRRRLRALGYIR